MIQRKSLYLQSVKNGCFERVEIVKIGGVNLVKFNFVDLKRNLLTIKNMLATITSTNMERISIQSDSPGYIKVSEIGKELIAFSEIIEKKYNQIDFELAFCFRALYTTRGINSKVRFYKDENWLGMDLIMPVDEFNPYKNNISMQRRIMGKYFFPFFLSIYINTFTNSLFLK